MIAGQGAQRAFTVDRELVIGRENADVTIDDPELSRRHTAVRPADGGGIEIRDLGSTNGTFVNGKRIEAEVVLRISGTMRIGTTEMAVEVPPPAVTKVSPNLTAPPAGRHRCEADASTRPARRGS